MLDYIQCSRCRKFAPRGRGPLCERCTDMVDYKRRLRRQEREARRGNRTSEPDREGKDRDA
jgi:hypothetical protein